MIFKKFKEAKKTMDAAKTIVKDTQKTFDETAERAKDVMALVAVFTILGIAANIITIGVGIKTCSILNSLEK